jgi:hypothetical protein
MSKAIIKQFHFKRSRIVLSIILVYLVAACSDFDNGTSSISVRPAGGENTEVSSTNELGFDPITGLALADKTSLVLPVTTDISVNRGASTAPVLASATGGSAQASAASTELMVSTQSQPVATASVSITDPVLQDVTQAAQISQAGNSDSLRKATVVPTLFAGTSIGNSIEITEPLSIKRTNYPMQLGRYFAKGEYKEGVQVAFNGTSLLTQVDVKNRWPDGSIKFAVIAFVVPTIEARSRSTVVFDSVATNQTARSIGNQPVLDFAAIGDFALELNFGGIKRKVSVSQMAASLTPVYWTRGDIATTFTLVDHSVERKFDIGSSVNRAVRPSFQVTVWHQLRIAKVRISAETSNVAAFEDDAYDVKLTSTKGSLEQTAYEQFGIKHHAGARWTQTAWLGYELKPLSIKHNVAYLSRTGAIPNFDPNLVVPESQTEATYTKFKANSQGLFATGLWTKYMPAPGGRDDIAIFPSWGIDAAITGDHRLLELADKQAELAGAWPMHFREGAATKKFDKAGAHNALGLPISLYGRPSLNISIENRFMRDSYIRPDDQIKFGVSATNNGWIPDGSHQPAPYFLPYIFSGDPWFLEQMQFWASWGAYLASIDLSSGFYGRGPLLTSGQLSGDIRSQAWILRNRVAAAVFSPDGSKEKQYFDELTQSAITIAEAIRDIRGAGNEGSAEWNWGASTGRNGFYPVVGISPLRAWDTGNTGFAIPYHNIDPTKIEKGFAPFQMSYMIIALDHVKYLGYPSEKLLDWAAPFVTVPLAKPTTANLIGMFAIPWIAVNPSRNLRSWDEVLSYIPDPTYPQTFANQWINSVDGMPLIMTAATATVANHPGGQAAWTWVDQNWRKARTTPVSSRWAIIPRR